MPVQLLAGVPMAENIAHQQLSDLIGGRLGSYDVACPLCGPERRASKNRTRAVLRVWHEFSGFITYSCARCGAYGYARASGAAKTTHRAAAIAPSETARASSRETSATRRDKARWLWNRRQPVRGTCAEVYLRNARRYGGTLPGSIGFLPARADHLPAMMAAFGVAEEIEPGVIQVVAVTGVHLTRLAPGGRSKAGTDADKIMIGTPRGFPIVLAPPNDLNGLAIAEGIEDALSVHEATGLGAWAAGAASFLPALAAAVPEWIECITILVDDDEAGRRNTDLLAEQLERRRFPVRMVTPRLFGVC